MLRAERSSVAKQKKRRDQQSSTERDPAPSLASDSHEDGSAKRMTDAQQNEQIKKLKGRIARGEKYMIGLTFAMVVVAALQSFMTREQIQDARRALELEQRAWIGVKDVSGEPVAGKPMLATVTVHNSGSTPAREITVQYFAVLGVGKEYPPTPTFNPSADRNTERRSVAVAPPGMSFSVIAPVRGIGPDEGVVIMNESLVTAIAQDQFRIYVYGRVMYKDVFDSAHWLDFCYLYVGSQRGYAQCREHNDFDKSP